MFQADTSNDLFKEFFIKAPISSVIIDEHDLIMNANHAASKFFEYPLDELIGKTIQDLFVKSSIQQYKFFSKWLLDHKKEASQGTNITFFAVTKNGIMKPCDIGFSQIQNNMLCTFTDTDKKLETSVEKEQSFIKLKESSNKTKRILNTINDGYWEWPDIDSDNINWNTRLFELLDYKPHEIKITYPQFLAFIHPNSRDEFIAGIKKSLAEGSIFESEIQIQTKNGAYKWFKTNGKAFNPRRGIFKSFGGSITDIHDLKSTKEELISHQEKFDRAIAGTQDGLWDWNLKEETTWVSPRFKEILGICSPSQTINSTEEWFSIVHPKDTSRLQQELSDHFEKNTPFITKYRIKKGDNYIWVRVKGNSRRDQNGNPTYMSGSLSDITQQESLREEQSRMAALLDSTTDYIGCSTPDGQTIFINKAFQDITGYSQEEASQLPISAFHPQSAVDKIITEGLPSATKNGSWNAETELITKDKTTIPVSQLIVSHKNDLGELLYFSTTLRNITHEIETRKKLQLREQELQIANLQYELAIDGASVGIWEWEDNSTKPMFWSKNFYKLLGISQNITPTIKYFDSLVHPEDYEDTVSESRQFLKTGSNLDTEFRLKTESQYRWFRCTAVLQRDIITKRALRVVGSIQDIHDKKRAENLLRIEKTRLSIALESANIAVWEWDVKNDKLTWDERMFEIYDHVPRREIYYSDWKNSIHPEDLTKTEETLFDSLKNTTRQTMSFRIRAKNNTIKFIEESHIPIFDQNGELSWVIGNNIDVTASKHQEQKLEAANQRLRQFVFTISHDLKAPLVTIKSFAEMVANTTDTDPKTSRWLKIIIDNSEHLEKLLDELLALSQIIHQKPDFKKTDLIEVMLNARNSISATLEKNNTHLSIPLEGPQITGHKKLLEQIFTNLLTNAVKYKKDDTEPIIKIEINEHKDSFLISVSDNGKGIDPKHRNLVFQLFERINPEDETVSGTGVGLSIVHSIVEKHGGTIWIEDNEMNGSTFKFTLPKK